MATYTPNLSLYMPDSTDDFGEFREEHNDNMVKIDNAIGGGGGSGGHTIVNPSGSDMPAEGKLQFTGGVTVTDDSVNGKTVIDISGGGGNVYGAFIDTNRVITSGTYNTSHTYTATEDCFVVAEWVSPQNDSAYFSIDGERAFTNYASSSVDAGTITLPLKKGQVLTGTTAYNSTKSYKVYGVVQGTSGIFTPIIYSDTERVVGVWRDNKPLYARSFHYSFTASSNDYSYDIETLSSDIVVQKIETDRFSRDGVIFNEVIYPPNTIFFRYGVDESTHKLGVRVWNSDTDVIDGTVTLLYTKTTDVAGSGNWNTDGVPTVHYSTSEQVIGTWENGKPLYQQTVIFDTGNVASNIDFNISSYMPVNSVVRHSSFTLDFSFNGDTYHGANWGGAYVEINGVSYLSFNIGSAVYNKHVELTIKYTKTTD